MYQCKVDVYVLNAVKSVLADVLRVSPSLSRAKSFLLRFTAMPTQTKTSSHRD